MKRKAKTTSENKVPIGLPSDAIEWKNYGGKHRLRDGTVINMNGTFWASPVEVPEAFRDKIRPLHPVDSAQRIKVVEGGHHIAPSNAGDGLFDIVNAMGHKLNTDPLSEEEAEKLLSKLKQ